MINDPEKINQLLDRLNLLLKRQDEFSNEIKELSLEIYKLKIEAAEPGSLYGQKSGTENITALPGSLKVPTENKQPLIVNPAQVKTATLTAPPVRISDIEKFIGENLINKIGIAITVIGVFIGAKYSIEHELISPLTRIIMGYLFGTALLLTGIWLKKKYENFSAVLVSGAMAILYFITYTAYSFYQLMPQLTAFLLMLLFTSVTVFAALKYNRQVIAHIGMVGAYAVPFLLSEGSGRVAILFSYMAIINTGILFISFKKYWKPLYYVSFLISWIIFFSWYAFNYNPDIHFELALIFLSLFFVIFYLTFLAYKLIRHEKFEMGDIVLVLINSFIFYGIGYNLLAGYNSGNITGLFTLINAVIHLIVSVVISRQKLADRNLFYLVSGLFLLFVTIAIPVQLDASWVTLLWVGEAALLFWIGRTKNMHFYERLSYALMILALLSIAHDWVTVYGRYNPAEPSSGIRPLLNIHFLSSLLFIAAFTFINKLNLNKKYSPPPQDGKSISTIFPFAIPAILIATIYFAFRVELANYWDQLYADSALILNKAGKNYRVNNHLVFYKNIWLINYSLLFFSILSFINIYKIRSQLLGFFNLAFNLLFLFAFLASGLLLFSELREQGNYNPGVRYISIAFAALTLFACYHYTRQAFLKFDFSITFDFVLHIAVIWIASSELIHWIAVTDPAQSYKLGLSILWGVYSLFLISLGIWKKKKHLRVGAIALFGVTLCKLFFYDISHLDTISKTIVFVSLGVLLLIISFLYNKYKLLIAE